MTNPTWRVRIENPFGPPLEAGVYSTEEEARQVAEAESKSWYGWPVTVAPE